MSIQLPSVNLASFAMNQSGTVLFQNVGISAGGVSANPSQVQNFGKLQIYNESGSGLAISMITSQDSFYLPAGAWTSIDIKPGETGLKFTIVYIISSPPVSVLLMTYYFPNENVPSVPVLGNSPIGGTASTTSATTISNESNSSQTLVIDIGQVGHTLLITINSDGSASWSVLQSSVAHAIFNIQTSGNPLQLGQSNDVTEVLGFLNIDNVVTLPNNTAINMKDSGGTGRTVLKVDNTDQVVLSGNSGPGGGAGAVVLSSNSGAIFKIQPGAAGPILLSGSLGLIVGTISRINGGVASCGSGTTISHGLGVTPDLISGTPVGSQPFSATVGIGNVGSSTFQATVGSGSQIDWTAIKG